MNGKTDWSQYEVKSGDKDIDWSQYEVDDDGRPLKSSVEATPFNDQEPERTGILGIAGDAADLFGNALKSGADFVGDLPENLDKAKKYREEHPYRAPIHVLGQALAASANIGKGIVNTPHDLLKYMLRKHLALDIPIPGTNIHTSDLIPHIPEDTGVENFLGLEADPEKGDTITRAIPHIAATLAGGRGLVRPYVKYLKSPSKETMFQRALERQIDEAKGAHESSLSEQKDFEDALRLKYSKAHGERIGEVSPVGQEVSTNIKRNEMAEQAQAARTPKQSIGEIPPEPDTQAIVQAKKDAAIKAREDLEKSLGSLDNPRLKGGAIVQKGIKDLKNTASNLYDSARKIYVDKRIQADNSAEIKSVTSDLEKLKNEDDLAPGYGSGTDSQKSLESQLAALEGEQVNASDVFDLQRTLEKMASDTRKKQYSGVSELDFKRLGTLSDRLESHADTLAKRLESVGGEDVQAMISEANKGWKSYKDVSKNTVGRPALKKGELPTRAMIDMASTESGNDFLQALTEAYPELKRHMLAAHVGESSVNKLLKPTTLTKKYLKGLPDVEDKVQALQEAIAGVRDGHTKASEVKKDYAALVKSMKDAADEQAKRADAIRNRAELRRQIKFHQEAIPKLEAKIKAADAKGAQYKKLVKELDDHKKNLQDKNYRLKKLVNIVLKGTGISALGHKIGL